MSTSRNIQPPGVPAVAPPRLHQIDGLRGIAAAAVVLFHYTTRFDQLFAHSEAPAIDFRYGYLGVQLFFVISGFVIFMTLERAKAPLDFVVSRFSRLFPTYWTAVAVTASLLAIMAIPGFQPPASHVLANLSMVQETFGIGSIDGAYWSLEIELIFYVWMLGLWSLGLLRSPVVVFGAWVAVATGVLLVGEKTGLWIPHGISHAMLFKWIPWFCLGIAAYLRYRQGRWTIGPAVLVLLSIAAIAMREGGAGLAPLAVVYLGVIVLASMNRVVILDWKPLVWLGAVSNPLYLLHDKIGWATMLNLESRSVAPSAAILVAIALSLVAAWIVHRLVEKPATHALRKRYRLRRQAAVEAQSQAASSFSRWRWGAACGAVICVAVAGGLIGRLAKSKPPEPATVALNEWRSGDHAAPQACEKLRALGAPLIVVLGQSNAASHGQPDAASPPTWIFHAGACGLRGDPLPGTTGRGASIWPWLAQRLEAQVPQGPPVVLAPIAVGGTRIGHWTSPGPLNALLQSSLAQVAASGLPVRAVVWQQGEADMLAGTSVEDYQAGLRTLGRMIAARGIDAPLYIARSTYCRQAGTGAIRRGVERYLDAQDSLRVRAGPDTDLLLGENRYDGCHFSAIGLKRAGALWAEYLAGVVQRQH